MAQARNTFTLVMHTDFAAPAEWETAGEWLALDDAERGAWFDIAERATLKRPTSRVGGLMTALALWFEGARPRNQRTRIAIWLRWTITPGRLALRSFVARALQSMSPTWAPKSVHTAHISCIESRARSAENVLSLIDLWDTYFANIEGDSAAISAFREEVERDLTDLSLSVSRLPPIDSCPEGSLRRALLTRVSEQLETDLRFAFDHVPPLEAVSQFGPGLMDFWYAWANIARTWRTFETLVTPPNAARLFERDWYQVSAWSIDLYNRLAQPALSHALFSWLAHTAKQRGSADDESVSLSNLALAKRTSWTA